MRCFEGGGKNEEQAWEWWSMSEREFQEHCIYNVPDKAVTETPPEKPSVLPRARNNRAVASLPRNLHLAQSKEIPKVGQCSQAMFIAVSRTNFAEDTDFMCERSLFAAMYYCFTNRRITARPFYQTTVL